MAKILQLDPHVADLIAAGEVVERPGSVVKELIENSIDAGATVIGVEIKNGGMSYIRVTDNGCGIPAEDAETAFLRHATSKLRDEYGLEAIGTLGFRGEALAAIAAVSKISLLTREAGTDEGVSLELEGGAVVSRSPAGCPDGTTMIVRDLFFNTPARLKFMKTDKAEGANVSAAVLRCALSHPEVSIRYIKDGKEEYHTPGDGRVDSCMYSLLGRDFANGMLSAETSDGDVSVKGYVSAPHSARGNRSYQFFFVNGRFVKSKTLQAALEQAYKNTLFTGRFPSCILYITLRPNAVDVNVHPAKTEVKFLNERQVFDGVYYAALSALNGETKKAELDLAASTRSAISHTATNEDRDGPTPRFSSSKGTGKPVYTSSSGGFKSKMPLFPETSSRTFVRDETRVPYQTKMNAPKPRPADTPPRDELPLPDGAEERDYRIIGECMKTYILVERGDSLWLIDKHAAHERIHFDRLSAQERELMTQVLLTPLICTLGAEDSAALLENADALEKFGFEVDQFGEAAVAVRQIPSDIDASDVESFLAELCSSLRLGGSSGPEAVYDSILHTVACKAAIKAGRSSHPAELEKLVSRVMSGEIKYCPHGRPVAIEITKASIDKNFKRT